MYETKLLLFLEEEVFYRPLRTNHRRSLKRNADGEEVRQTLGPEAVEQYVSALCNLYHEQVSLRNNTHPSPRGVMLHTVLDNRLRGESKRRKQQYVDRGANTLMDTYDDDSIRKLVQAGWKGWESQPKANHASINSFLRTGLDFILAHNMILRGEVRRQIELADLFTLELQNEGPTPCMAVVLLMDNGKTNQRGRTEYAVIARHKDVSLCAQAMLAFYLFYRWEVVREAPPRFQQNQEWYDMKLFPGANATARLSYDSHLKWTNELYAAADLSFLKKTHLGRTGGAQSAELKGVEEAQIRRAGHWNNDAMSTCYLSRIPRSFVRSMAGFEPHKQGNYFLKRAQVQPPASLLRAIWPWVEDWQAWFNCHLQKQDPISHPLVASSPHLRLRQLGAAEEDRTDRAGQGFLKLLAYLKVVLLQDSVLLRQQYPAHPIFRHGIFKRDDYVRFANEVEHSVTETKEPAECRLADLVPDLTQHLAMLHQDLKQVVSNGLFCTQSKVEAIERRQEDFYAGKFAVTIHAPNIGPLPPSLPRTTGASPLSPARARWRPRLHPRRLLCTKVHLLTPPACQLWTLITCRPSV